MRGGFKLNTNNYEFKESSLYAIKESHNLAMLTAATSVSALLNGNVWITNPESAVSRIMDFIYADLSPSVFVKLTYELNANFLAKTKGVVVENKPKSSVLINI